MDRLFKQKTKADYLFYIDFVGKRLYEFRKDRRESLRAVGKAVGVSPAQSAEWKKAYPISGYRDCFACAIIMVYLYPIF